MDESNRLKQLPNDLDVALFNKLYKETKSLMRKLAFEIDARKFGVDYNEILSWFDVKFIYTFNKYYGNPRLKGYIINSLKTYKLRIVKNSYQQKYLIHETSDIDECFELSYEEPESSTSHLLEVIQNYFKNRLTPDAFLLWELELNPPPYILIKLQGPNAKIPKPSDELILEYLGIEVDDRGLIYLSSLRKEIKDITKRAKEYFQYKSIKF